MARMNLTDQAKYFELKLKERDQRIIELAATRDSLKRKNDELSEKCAERTNKVMHLAIEVDGLQRQITDLQTANSRLSGYINRIREEDYHRSGRKYGSPIRTVNINEADQASPERGSA